MMKIWCNLIVSGALLLAPLIAYTEDRVHAYKEAEILSVQKIWNKARHNAFTDLVRFRGNWFCAFREAEHHWHPHDDGKIRILTSRNGKEWTSAALIAQKGEDLRDSKLSITPDKRLMIVYFRRFNPTRFPDQSVSESDLRRRKVAS